MVFEGDKLTFDENPEKYIKWF